MDINILSEDSDVIVIEKPPGMPCQRDKSGDEDVMGLLQREYLGVVHRLDRPVGGVMVYGKNQKATSWLSKAISDRAFHKEYLAVVCGIPEKDSGELVDNLKKLRRVNMSKVVEGNEEGSKEAILEYRLLETISTREGGQLSLLHIVLKTGRHHQIRVQLSHAGIPLWGDTKYNKKFKNRKGWFQISLWSHRIKFRHPGGRKVSFYSNPVQEYPWSEFQLPDFK